MLWNWRFEMQVNRLGYGEDKSSCSVKLGEVILSLFSST